MHLHAQSIGVVTAYALLKLHDRMHYKLEGADWRVNRLAP